VTTKQNRYELAVIAVAAFGLLSDLQSQTLSVWTNAVNGNWSDAGAWSAGVPNGNMAYLTNSSASYAVTVDATPAPFGSLTISTAAGLTTRLNVDAPDFTSSNNLSQISIGRGAEVVVNSGGILRYTGRTFNWPFISILNGGLLRVNGGTVDLTNLMRESATAGNSYMGVGFNSTGRLEIASGEFVMAAYAAGAETNNSVQLRIGTGTAGRGTFEMTGGKAWLRNNDNSSSLSVGSGAQCIGTVLLTNDAVLVVSNFVNVGTANATGSVTIAGNAVFRQPRSSTRFQVGIEGNALGTITVRENGALDLVGQDGLNVGGYQNNGRGVLNIEGGRVDAGAGVSICRAAGSKGGVGELNLTGGELGTIGKTAGYGILVGRGDGAGGSARAYMKVSGGLLDIGRFSMWNQWDQQQGIVLGLMATNVGNTAWGEVRFSGGTVTNSGQFILGAGYGATGLVYQTGGAVRQGMGNVGVNCFQMTVGWGGGYGSYTMSGGTFVSAKPVYVGGLTTTDLGYTPGPAIFVFTNASVGTLRIEGGSFMVTNQNLYLGRNGAGTLTIASNGVCFAKDIVLTNNTQSTLRFELGTEGLGTLTASSNLVIYTGAKLEVDTSAYQGKAVWIKLVDCATRTGSFDPANITITGQGEVKQSRNNDQDVWLFFRRGTMIGIL
jgi:T5SS/PEP-CTERM-associated repeat protein